MRPSWMSSDVMMSAPSVRTASLHVIITPSVKKNIRFVYPAE